MADLSNGGENFRSADVLPRDLVRVLDWLKAHLAEPVDLDRLATVAGVPPRTLETHFQQYLRMSPLAFVRRMRLAHARRQLLTGEASVTDIALSIGFNQLGRFSGYYREQFRELPSQTRLRARKAASNERAEIDDEAMFLAWRGLASAYTVAARQCGAAMDDVAQAQELSPRYGLPKAIMAWCNGQRAAHNFDSGSPARAAIAELAAEAAAIAPDDPLALNAASGAMALAHRLHEADALIERALAIDPWSALNWIRRAWVSAYVGDSDNAVREFGVAFHMSPLQPVTHVAYIGIGCAHFAAGRYDRATRWIRHGVDSCPGSFWGDRIAAAAASHYGARAEARRIARRLLRKDPDLTVTAARNSLPFPPSFIDRLGDGLRNVGVPLS